MKKGALALALLATSVGASAETYQEKVVKKLAKMTPADFAKGITVEDDDMSTVAVVSSAKVLNVTKGMMILNDQSDVALKAGVDKKDGRTVFQVQASIVYSGGWHYYETGAYMTANGPKDARLDVLNRDVSCFGGGCLYSERLAFAVDETTLRQIASTTAPWRLRFAAKQGGDRDELMSPLEVSALLAAVDRYRASRPAA